MHIKALKRLQVQPVVGKRSLMMYLMLHFQTDQSYNFQMAFHDWKRTCDLNEMNYLKLVFATEPTRATLSIKPWGFSLQNGKCNEFLRFKGSLCKLFVMASWNVWNGQYWD